MDLDALNISDLSDVEIAARMRDSNYEKFKSLVRMHLSFQLDLNTDAFDLPCHEIVYEDKGKVKRWNRVSKKHKGSGGCSAYVKGVASAGGSPMDSLQQQIDAGFLFHLQELKEFLLLERNVTQEGLFRKTGSASRQNDLRLQIQNEKPLDLEVGGYSAHDCATVFKGYLAELPEPLLTDAHYPAHLQIAPLCMSTSLHITTRNANDSSSYTKPQNPERLKREQHLLSSLQLVLLLLPAENRRLLKDVIEMLHVVAAHAQINKMTAENLATLFAPHLICPRNLPPEALHYVAKKMASIIAYLIQKGGAVFEVPAKLATDIRAYFMERKRRKTMSPEHTLDDSISDMSTVNTVYTFVDREKTAAAHTANNTDTELAQLYAHIQSLPESSKKRRLIKQFNKQNGQGTPLQFVVMNRLKNSEATRSAKSIGDSIKKHIFHKSIMSRTPKRMNQPVSSYGNETPSFSSSKNPKLRVLFQSPASTPTSALCAANDPSCSSCLLTPTCLLKTDDFNSMSHTPSTTSSIHHRPPACKTNTPSFIVKTHPLQKSISSSSLPVRASCQVDEEGINTISLSSSSSSSSSYVGSSCSSTDDFQLQSTSNLSISAPVSRQTSCDLNFVTNNCTSSPSLSNADAGQHLQTLDANSSITPSKIVLDVAKQLIGGSGNSGDGCSEKKSILWDEDHITDIEEFPNSCTPIVKTESAIDLKARYKSEPNLSHLVQNKLNSDESECISGQKEVTPICKGKLLTNKLIKGVSMGNLKLPFSTPDTKKQLVKLNPSEDPMFGIGSLIGRAENNKVYLDDTYKDVPQDNVDDKKESGDKNTVSGEDDDDFGQLFSGGSNINSSELHDASSGTYKHLLHHTNICRNLDLITTSTPSMLSLGRRSMSPITKSTQRMPKAMQESIMTPRSRKPVMMLTNTLVAGSSSDQNLTACQPDLTSFREQDEDSSSSVVDNTHVGVDSIAPDQPLNIDEDALDGYNVSPQGSRTFQASSNTTLLKTDIVTDSLSHNFKEYLLRRSVVTASPVDSSFSSQPDDFTAHDGEDLDTSLNPSLIFCLNGNQPADETIVSNTSAENVSLTQSYVEKATNSTSRVNRLASNPFIIMNNARKRAATGDVEKLTQHNCSIAANVNSSVLSAFSSTPPWASTSTSANTNINVNSVANVVADKENYEHSQGYLQSKKLLVSEYPGETSF